MFLTGVGSLFVSLLLGYLCIKANRIAAVLVFLCFFLLVAFNTYKFWDQPVVIYKFWDRNVVTVPLFVIALALDLALLLVTIHGVRGSFAVHRHRRAEKLRLAVSNERGVP